MTEKQVQGALRTRRIYESPRRDDGYRVLVDRLWPRGIAKAAAALDEWARDLAPSTELRAWFHADRARFPEFARRYEQELAGRQAELYALAARAGSKPLTLLTAAKDIPHSHVPVLMAGLKRRGRKQ